MGEGEIGFEVFVPGKGAGISVSGCIGIPSPVLRIGGSVSGHFVVGQTAGALLVGLGRAQGGEVQGVVRVELFGEHRQIGPGTYSGALGVTGPPGVRAHQAEGPPAAQSA